MNAVTALVIGLILAVAAAALLIYASAYWYDDEPASMARLRMLYPSSLIAYEHGPSTAARWGFEWRVVVSVGGKYSHAGVANSFDFAARNCLYGISQAVYADAMESWNAENKPNDQIQIPHIEATPAPQSLHQHDSGGTL